MGTLNLKAVLLNRCNIHRCFLNLRNIRRNCSSYSLQLADRGLLEDTVPSASHKQISKLTENSQTVYAGFDPTAPSLHVGNLLVLINLMHWQRAGHNVIVLLGSATALIGDPSGKSKERKEMFKVEVEKNCDEIEKVVKKIFKNHETMYEKQFSKNLTPIKILNNWTWYENMNVLTLLRDIGRHFRVGTMLGKESVRDRIKSGAGISYSEFSYQILQAYDWMHLLNKYKCQFQVGGNDQQGNMMAGRELVDRVSKKKVFGLTVPLVKNEEGDKFGKTAGNCMWLSNILTTPFQLYQFFIKTKDSEVESLLKLFTFLPLPEISDIMEKHKSCPEERGPQKILAQQVTCLVHGTEAVEKAEKTSSIIYDSDLKALSELQPEEIGTVFEGTKIIELHLRPATTILEAAMRAGCFQLEDDAIRIISEGGFYINQERVCNMEEILTPAGHILPNNITIMRVGKKNYTIVKWF